MKDGAGPDPAPPPAVGADGAEREAGSFRDRDGSVHYRDGRVLRTLSPRACRNWQLLRAAPFFADGMDAGRIVRTTDCGPRAEGGGLVEHARIPFVSYPYEWPFGMLKDAALLHLELMREALAAGFDPEGFVALQRPVAGRDPVFIDVPSFVPLGPASLGSATASSASCCSIR